VAEGRSRKEISGILNISVKTVEFHKGKLMQKLNLQTVADFTRYAIEAWHHHSRTLALSSLIGGTG
jgi:DNA-binding CsgD family transcriptional regulator